MKIYDINTELGLVHEKMAHANKRRVKPDYEIAYRHLQNMSVGLVMEWYDLTVNVGCEICYSTKDDLFYIVGGKKNEE